MSNIDPGVDLTWARTVPAFGTTQPIYPTFSPPQFDAAKAYEAANSVQAGKLGNQIKQNEISQLPVENALRAAQAAGAERSNRIGAATETDQTAADVAKAKADTAASMASIPESQQKVVVYRADALESATTAVEQVPDPGQADAEIERQAQQLKAAGVEDGQVNAWKTNVKNATYRAHYHAVAQAARDQYRQTLSLGAGRDTALTNQDTRYSIEAEKAYKAAITDGKTPAEAEQARQDELARLQGRQKPMPATGSPAAGATPTVAPPGVWDQATGYVESLFGGGKTGVGNAANEAGKGDLGVAASAAAGSVQADKASREAQVAGKTIEAKPTETPAKEQAVGDGSTENPFRFTGDPNDEQAQHDWVKKIPEGKTFANPGYDPTKPTTDKSNFKLIVKNTPEGQDEQ